MGTSRSGSARAATRLLGLGLTPGKLRGLQRICNEILPAYLADNLKARTLGPDGEYSYVRRGKNGKGFSVQNHLMAVAHGGVNGSGKTKTAPVPAAYTAPTEPTVPADEVLDSSNATV